jgi:uncharacterized membrane protein YkoI
VNKRSKMIIVGAATVALAAGASIAIAGSDDDGSETPIRGDDLARASDAALDYTGGGTVTGTEVGDEESYYEVEVTRDDESQVDVQLNRDSQVVGGEDDDDSSEDE